MRKFRALKLNEIIPAKKLAAVVEQFPHKRIHNMQEMLQSNVSPSRRRDNSQWVLATLTSGPRLRETTYEKTQNVFLSTNSSKVWVLAPKSATLSLNCHIYDTKLTCTYWSISFLSLHKSQFQAKNSIAAFLYYFKTFRTFFHFIRLKVNFQNQPALQRSFTRFFL